MTNGAVNRGGAAAAGASFVIRHSPFVIPPRGGFALVATLFFVFLLIGILTALVSLTIVEMRVVDNTAKLRQARGNALSGVGQAIHELQTHAGLDQRVTGPASLLDTNPKTSEPDGVANPWLTGIWPGGDGGKAAREPMVWLISGAKMDAKSEKPPITHTTPLPDPASGNDMVWLLNHAVGEDDKLRVKARKLDIKRKHPTRSADKDTAYTVGHRAWWVADEGVKARVNLVLPEEESVSEGEKMMLAKWKLAAPRRASWKAEDFHELPKDPDDLVKVLSFAQIPLLVEGDSERGKLQEALEKHFHDITANSLGLLTDSRDGGLKRDLSLAFEMPDAEFRKQGLFSGSDDDDAAEAAGKQRLWWPMRDFYRTYKEVRNAAESPSLEARPYSVTTDADDEQAQAAAANTWLDAQSEVPAWRARYSPQIIRLEHAFSVLSEAAESSEEGGPDQKLALVMDPIATLWNPHNIALEFDAFRLDPAVPTLRLVVERRDPWNAERAYRARDEVWHENRLYRARVGNRDEEPPGENNEWESLERTWTLATDISLRGILRNHEAMQSGSFLFLDDKAAVNSRIIIKPGELVVFSPNNTAPQKHGSGDLKLRLERGWNAKGGISFDKLADDRPRPPGPAVDEKAVMVYTGSQVRITLEPLRDGSYATDDPFQFVKDYRDDGLDLNPTEPELQAHRESIGYFQGGGSDLDSFAWAGTRRGEPPRFTYRTRAYHGEDDGGRPLPGMSDVLAVGRQVTDKAKRFLGLLDWYLKTEADADGFPVQMISRFDPRAVLLLKPDRGYPCTIPQCQVLARRLTSDIGIIEMGGKSNGYWGPSNTALGERHVPLFEIPTAPLLSLGQLQHFQAGVVLGAKPATPGYVLGGSYASPFVPREQTVAGEGGAAFVDLSHELNRQIYDRFFFSSICPRTGDETTNGRLSDFLADEDPKPLPNPRMKLYLTPGQTLARLRQRLIDPGEGAKSPYASIAANLMVEGAFNVNSSSVEAWKALLASLDGFYIPTLDPSQGAARLDGPADSPHSRFALTNGGSSDRWRGFRSLTDEELQHLAEAIVEQVKTRGPFTSLGDFVNRRLKDDDTGLWGALQAAIDRSGINRDFATAVTEEKLREAGAQGAHSGEDWNFPHPEHAIGPIGAGAAGFLTQGDLLQALAPHLAVRSDTFKIRAYGDVVNPFSGRLEARAWCEVIVQRLPEYVNYAKPDVPPEEQVSDPPWAQTENLQNESNLVYGRRFRIVRLRWLSPDEV